MGEGKGIGGFFRKVTGQPTKQKQEKTAEVEPATRVAREIVDLASSDKKYWAERRDDEDVCDINDKKVRELIKEKAEENNLPEEDILKHIDFRSTRLGMKERDYIALK